MKFNKKNGVKFLNQEDILIFAEEKESVRDSSGGIWNILIVDDEPQVHQVTKNGT